MLLRLVTYSLTLNSLLNFLSSLPHFPSFFCHLALAHISNKLLLTKSLHQVQFPSYCDFLHMLSDIVYFKTTDLLELGKKQVYIDRKKSLR